MRLTLDGRQHCKFPLRRFDPAGTASCIAPDRNTRLARVRKPRILRRNQAWRRSVLRGAIKRAKPARDGGCSFPHPVRPGGRGKERSSSIGVSYYLIAFFDLKNVDHDGNVVGKMTGLNKGAEDGAASSGAHIAFCLCGSSKVTYPDWDYFLQIADSWFAAVACLGPHHGTNPKTVKLKGPTFVGRSAPATRYVGTKVYIS